MSKWINKDLFAEFTNEKKNEVAGGSGNDFSKKWSVEKGTADNPKTFEVRFLPDKKQGFYKKYYYHMWKIGEKWTFVQCPKTHDFNNPCPICSVVNKLFAGSETDKNEARKLKRKQKFISNVFIAHDPRDAEKDADDKVEGTVKIYEFPSKLEQKLSEEIKDTRNGLGAAIFDPSEEGYNFIIKVGTQSGGSGQSFPEYSMSMFARRPSPIAESDEKIEELMEERIDLNEYLGKQNKPIEELIQLMKDEMFWDLISSEYARYEKAEEKKETSTTKKEEVKVETSSSSSEEDDTDVSEADLLAELENF